MQDAIPAAADARALPPTSGLALLAGLATALTFAFLDATVDLQVRSPSSPSPLSTGPVVGAGFVLAGLAFALGWVALGPLARALRRDSRAVAAGLAAALGAFAAGPLLACYRGVAPQFSALHAVAALAVGALVAVAVEALLRGVPGSARWLRSALFAAPVLSGAALALAWARSGALGGAAAALAALAAVAGALALTVVAHRAGPRFPRVPLLAVAGVAGVALAALRFDPRESGVPDAGRRAPGAAPRQALLVVVDTLRADFLSYDDPDAPPTPNLDALAARSVRFTNARSPAPWTYPSMCSMLSGLSPAVHLGLRPRTALARPVPTIAQRVDEAGLKTAAFVRNPALWRTTDLDRGFQEFHYFREPRPVTALSELALRRLAPAIYAPRVGADVQTDAALEWLDANADRDFFVWLHYFDPHMTYEPPEDFLPGGEAPPRIGPAFGDAARVRGGFFNPDGEERQWIRELYAGEVRFLDQQIGRLFDALEERGLMDDLVLVFASDHGEEFWEHGLFEHGQALYDETVRVPLLLKLPGEVFKLPVEDDVSTESITPTLCELLGVPYDEALLTAPPLARRAADGTIALDLSPRPLPITGILYFEDRNAVVFDGLKYIRYEVGGQEELYDLRADPGETVDLAPSRPEDLARARAHLDAALERASELRAHYGILEARSIELDAATERDMRALGYVQ